jgi:hypothetical protein
MQHESLQQAEAAVRWLTLFGRSSAYYEWSVRPHPDGGWELWKTPRDGGVGLAEWRRERDLWRTRPEPDPMPPEVSAAWRVITAHIAEQRQ